MLMWLVLGFVLGVIAVLATEATALFLILDRLRRAAPPPSTLRRLPQPPSAAVSDVDHAAPTKKGFIWVFEPDNKLTKVNPNESPARAATEQNKKEIVEVFPVKKYAKVKDHFLVLFDLNGAQEDIDLQNARAVAVSASDVPSRKWAKRFPIKLESRKNGESRISYLYLDTSLEKESWCRALRLASCLDKGKLNWYLQLKQEFHHYLTSFNDEYHSLQKRSASQGGVTDKIIGTDGPSKVRLFLKKLVKRTAKSSQDNKLSSFPSSVRGDRNFFDRLKSLHDVSFGHVRTSTEKPSSDLLNDLVQPASPSFQGGDRANAPFISEAVDEKTPTDGGTLCWNLLFSRLFFDLKTSIDMKHIIKTRLQRTLSNMRVPSYIGGVICTGLDLGDLPPYIHGMRVLSMDLNDTWVMEADVEYLGGIVLDIETRLEVCEPELQKGIMNSSFEPDASAEATADLLEGIEYYENQLKYPNVPADQEENRNEGLKAEELKDSKSGSWKSSYMSRWKTIVQSLAEQVSQVPISLTIKIASLRGTLQIQIRPPPSDQLWYGFTSMPDIEWNLESSVGDRKFTSTHIAMLIGNRFKAAISDSLVLPNCECIHIPWMLAEKDDWAPWKVAPYIWINRQATDTSEPDLSNSQPTDDRTISDDANSNRTGPCPVAKVKKADIHLPQTNDVRSEIVHKPFVRDIEKLTIPLLDPIGECSSGKFSSVEPGELPSTTAVPTSEELASLSHDDDGKSKRPGRRARMMDLGKKMGEKLEEKKRHIEEKSRHIVEKMRENSRHDP